MVEEGQAARHSFGHDGVTQTVRDYGEVCAADGTAASDGKEDDLSAWSNSSNGRV